MISVMISLLLTFSDLLLVLSSSFTLLFHLRLLSVSVFSSLESFEFFSSQHGGLLGATVQGLHNSSVRAFGNINISLTHFNIWFIDPIGSYTHGSNDSDITRMDWNISMDWMSLFNNIRRHAFTLLKRIPVLITLIYSLLWNIVYILYAVASKVFYTVYLLISTLVWIIFEPFVLFINIIEYNVHIVIDFWLSVLFDTRLQDLITLEFGITQFKILAQWLRYVNVVCITALILGILVYYSAVRFIYWATKMEKTKKVKLVAVKVNPQPVESMVKEYTTNGPTENKEYIHSLFDDEDELFSLTSTPQSVIKTRKTSSLGSLTPSNQEQRRGQTVTESPITKAFRSRISSINTERGTISTGGTIRSTGTDYSYGTTASSIFSKTIPMTPISPIEEDEEY
jgi:hypothetical protein